MTNPERNPQEQVWGTEPTTVLIGDRPVVQVLEPRNVPLGGPRAMRVRRTLPQLARSDVAPHPHTGLQTASWLFTGTIEHRDSHGVHAIVRPGELNLMTGGHGICHSEVSPSTTTVLHGVQLWVALPDAHRDAPRNFQHYAPAPVRVPGAVALVFLGSLLGSTSPVPTYSPLLGSDILLDPGAALDLEIDPAFEHGVLVDVGQPQLEDTTLGPGQLGYVGTGVTRLSLTNPSAEPARVILIGGEPLGEEIVMWWNFVGRDHDEIVRYREQWQAEGERFGRVEGYLGELDRLPAPALPNARIRPRRNP